MSAIAQLPMPNTYVKLMTQATDDPERLLAGTGISVSEALDGDGPITVQQQLTCSRNSAAMQGRPDWHLAWVHRVAERFHGPISAAWTSAPTLGDGLDVFIRYMPTRIPYLRWSTHRDGERWHVELRPLMDLGDIGPLLVEFPLLTLGIYMRTLQGGRLDGVSFEFPHAALADLADYRRVIPADFAFDGRRAAMVMPAAARALPNPGYDEVLWTTALRRCEAAAQEHAGTAIINQVVEALHESLEHPWSSRTPPTLADMATHLHVSVSTLNRRLREASTSYQALVDDVRRQRARELLANPRQRVTDIAIELGFLDPSSFVRSFRRWYGATPGRYRRELAAGRR
ncbi:MAG: AraC family transcriptional regulator ligand-binding domain-containing protein [Gammaproteobacteria bacterium]|nr:AraC family transcriptional regulator ligand-binding domain-containing protein [Gammaproteobacteria bacterium]